MNARIFPLGFNRREDYGGVGCAIPPQLKATMIWICCRIWGQCCQDVPLPNDEIDLCDERGILAWEENHTRGLTLENMQNLNLNSAIKGDCIREMIENHYNYPPL